MKTKSNRQINNELTQDKVLLQGLKIIDKSFKGSNIAPSEIYQAKKRFILISEGKSTTCDLYPRKRYANK